MKTVLTLRHALLVLTGGVAAGMPPTPLAGQAASPFGQKNTITLSVAWRVKVNRMKSLLEQQPGAPVINGGGFAKYLVFASYARRF